MAHALLDFQPFLKHGFYPRVSLGALSAHFWTLQPCDEPFSERLGEIFLFECLQLLLATRNCLGLGVALFLESIKLIHHGNVQQMLRL